MICGLTETPMMLGMQHVSRGRVVRGLETWRVGGHVWQLPTRVWVRAFEADILYTVKIQRNINYTVISMGGDRKFLVPKYVYSPAGGWWRDPKHWRRNTAFAFGITFALCVPMFYFSAQHEVRSFDIPKHSLAFSPMYVSISSESLTWVFLEDVCLYTKMLF